MKNEKWWKEPLPEGSCWGQSPLNEYFAIAVFHFRIVTDSQKWTAVAWEPYIALKCEWLLNNIKLKT